MERWRDGEMEKWRNGEMDGWRNGWMSLSYYGQMNEDVTELL